MFTGGTDAKVEFPVLWPTDAKNRLTEKKKKMLMLGNTEGRRRGGHKRQDGWMASTTQ